ncbi:MAG: phytanoyl-CoA dioxygenase family protein, partial [Alphaproteobacteria bacterium]|nr:phytanoyl-CoA dioxygenase family protein [Alphaproteobacteria bacterium]
MGKELSDEQVACWRDQGYVAPVDVIDRDHAVRCRRQLEEAEAIVREKGWDRVLAYKAHVVMPFLVEIARSPHLLDAIEDVIGPDIVLYDSDFFIKEGHTPGFVSWHQDLTHCGFDGTAMVNCWVALAPSTVESGCLRVV